MTDIGTGTQASTSFMDDAVIAKDFSDVRHAGYAAIMFCVDHQNHFPAGKDSGECLQQLDKYLHTGVNVDVDLGQYTFNMAIAGQAASLPPEQSSRTVILYHKNPESDGARGVAFADGHCRMVGPDEWKTLQKQLGP